MSDLQARLFLFPAGPNFGRYKDALVVNIPASSIPTAEQCRELRNAFRLGLEECVRKKRESDQRDVSLRMRLVTSRLSLSTASASSSSSSSSSSADAGYSSPASVLESCSPATPATPPSIPHEEEETPEIEGSDYHARFNAALKDLVGLAPDTSEDSRRAVYKAISDVYSDFTEAACNYARVLILESGEKEKTIHAAGLEGSASLAGGVAGGVKYGCIRKIVFKSATERVPDPECKGQTFSFSDYDHAAKVAGHELKGCCNVMSAILTDRLGIRTPMMVLIEYLGMRVIGMTHLPVSHETLVHGSSNRRRDVLFDREVAADLAKVGARLNLKPHPVVSFDGSKTFTFHTPFDLEGHRAQDGSTYVLDFSRVFPPDGQDRDFSLSRLLRPELVATNPVPLSSDAVLSREDVEEVRRAAQRIPGLVVELAGELCQLPCAEYGDQLVLRMHQRGINLRFLGLLLDRLQFRGDPGATDWRFRVEVEMIARSFRKVVNAKLREELLANSPQDSRIKEVIVGQLNGLLAGEADPVVCTQFWDVIRDDCSSRFPGAAHWVPDKSSIIGVPWGPSTFLRLVTEFLGLEWYTDAWNALQDVRTYTRPCPVESTSIRAIVPRRKLVNLAYHSRGYYLRGQARIASKCGESVSVRYVLHGAIASFELALSRQPRNAVTQRNLAQSFEDQLMIIDASSPERPLLVRRIENLLQQAIEMRRDTNTLFDFAVFHDLAGNRDKAEFFYRQSLIARADHHNAATMLADLLADLALERRFQDSDPPTVVPSARAYKAEELLHEAESLYELCDAKLRKNPDKVALRLKPLNNRAVMLLERGRVLEAGACFCEAFSKAYSKMASPHFISNVSEFCRVVLMDDDLACSIESSLAPSKTH